jgi:hypothetical protein
VPSSAPAAGSTLPRTRHDTSSPTPRPERSFRTKGYSAEQLTTSYAKTKDQLVRDSMRLAVCYGLHASEVQRVGRGDARLRNLEGAGGIAGVVCSQVGSASCREPRRPSL